MAKHYESDKYPWRPYDIERLVRDLIRWHPSWERRIKARYALRYKIMTGRDIKTDLANQET